MFLKAGAGVRVWAKRGIARVAILATFFFILSSGAYAWLTGWNYRKPITITENSGSTLTDYQVLIELNSSNFDFSKANADGSDIRFTDQNDNLLDYWIEEWDSVGQTAKIWVKVPSIPASSSVTIYMYYGNSTATSLSNKKATFLWWDDFSVDSSVNYTWQHRGSGNFWITNGYLKVDPGSADYSWPVLVIAPGGTPKQFPDNILIESWVKADDDTTGGPAWWIKEQTGVSDTDNRFWAFRIAPGYNQYMKVTEKYDSTHYRGWYVTNNYVGHINTWYIIRVYVLEDKVKAEVYDTSYNLLAQTNWITDIDNKWGHWVGWRSADKNYVYYDNMLVRRYIDPEPTYSVGTEETYFSLNIVNSGKIYAASKVIIEITTTETANITANVTYNGAIISQNSCTSCTELRWLVDTPEEGQYNITVFAKSEQEDTTAKATFTVNRSIAFSHEGILKVYHKNTWQASLANTVEDAENITIYNSLKDTNTSTYIATNTTAINYVIWNTNAHHILEHEVYLCDVYGACWKYSKYYAVENSKPVVAGLLEKDQHYLAGETITLHPYYYDIDNDQLNLTFYLYNSTGLVKSFTGLTFSTGSTGVFTLEIKVCDAYNCSYANYTIYADAAINCLDSNLFTYYTSITCNPSTAADVILLNDTAYCLYNISSIAGQNYDASSNTCLWNSMLAVPAGGVAVIRHDYPTALTAPPACAANTSTAPAALDLPTPTLWHPTVTLDLKKEEDGTTWDDFTSYNISIKAYCSKYGDYEEKITTATYTGKKLRELPRRIDVIAQGDITVKSGIADYSNYYYRSIVPDTWQNINRDVYLSESKDKIYRLIWNLQDLVGTWGDSKLIIKKYVAGKLVTITENYWDVEGKAITYVVDGESYYVSIAKDGEERGFGWFDADSSSLEKQITIGEFSLTNPVYLYGKDVTVEVKTTTEGNNSYIVINYLDTLEQTRQVAITIYNFTTMQQLFTTTSTANSFSITYKVQDTNSTYLVRVTIKHAKLGTITQDWTVNFNENVFLLGGISEEVREWIAIALLLFTAVLFTAANAKIAIVMLLLELAAFHAWNWLPINTALLWLTIIIGAVYLLMRRV